VSKSGKLIGTSSFGDKITQGPSLDTLMKNHIDAYNRRDFRNSGSSGCLDIAADFSEDSVAEIQTDVQAGRSIFQSAKMCGDGDQVDELELAERDLQDPVGTFVFVSADRQAVLERRLRKGAAILHYSGTFTLYRNDKGVSDKDIAEYNALKSKKFVDDNTSLYNAIYDSINSQIDRLKADISTINTEFKTKVAVVNTLFTNRIVDMIAYLEKIQAIIGTLPVRTNDALTENVIKTAYAAFETNGIPISALIYLNKYVTLTSKNKAYPFLRFSLEDYKTLAVQITAATATMKSVRPVRIPEDFFSHLTQKEGYTETVDTLLESFFDPSLLDPTIIPALKLPEPKQADQDTVTQFIEADRIFSEISVTNRTKDQIKSHKGLLGSALLASTRLRTQLNIHFSTLTSVAAGGGSRQIGGARPEPDVLDKVLEVLKEASIFFNQRNLELENDVITINDDDGKMTVAEIKPVRKSFLSVIDSISPSDAATHAGDLLNRLNEIPVSDSTIEFIKLLLNPFNDDKDGYINKNHPIAREVSYKFITKKNAETPQDYHLGSTEEQGVVPRKNEREEYSSFYSMFPVEADLIYDKDGIKQSFNVWLEKDGKVSEYFRAAYYAQRYGIVTLAVLNDLVENDMTATGSLLKGFIVTADGKVALGPINKINLYNKWDRIPFILEAIFAGVIIGRISKESISLLIGGKRKNRKTRRRNNKHAKRITRRRKH
jgi:hypothetical protein